MSALQPHLLPSPYNALAKENGEIRLYVSTKDEIDFEHLNARLGFRYASRREHHSVGDPWEWAFADPRRVHSETDFVNERDRVVKICLAELRTDWELELLYHPPKRSGAIYHWSSSGGWMLPPSPPRSRPSS
jgi:hypothetical protein